MPGLCGIIEIGELSGAGRPREEISRLLRGTESALVHFPGDHTRHRVESGPFHIAAVGYPSVCHRVIRDDADGWTEIWFGEIHNGRQVSAGATAEDACGWDDGVYRGPSMEPVLASIAGCFTGIRYHTSTGVFEIFNDVLGSLPLCIRRTSNLLLFAPEAKALLEPDPAGIELDGPALSFFLSIGYLPPGHTRFHDIHMLPPASILAGWAAVGDTASRVSGDSHRAPGVKVGELCQRRYWNYGFPERIENRGRAFYIDRIAERLREVVPDHIRDGERTGICLSGGHDSRSLLGAARDLGKSIGGVTWGWNPGLEGSDAEISRLLAQAAGMRHRFVELDLHALPRNAQSWVWMTDGAIEGIYNYPQGADVFRALATEYDVLLRGDQSFVKWPFGVPNMDVARAAVGLYPFAWHSIYDDLILSDSRDRLTAAWPGVADEWSERLQSRDIYDRKDEIFYEVHLHSKMNALNYFKTLAVPVRNPLIDRRFLELVQSIPRDLRRGKSLFREMVETRSGFSAVPYATRTNLIPWREAIAGAPAVADFFRSRLLDAGSAFFEIVDREALEAQLASWLDRGAAAGTGDGSRGTGRASPGAGGATSAGGTRGLDTPVGTSATGGGSSPASGHYSRAARHHRVADRAKRIAYSRWSPGFLRDRIVPPRSRRRPFDCLFRLLVTAIHLDEVERRGIRASWNWSTAREDQP